MVTAPMSLIFSGSEPLDLWKVIGVNLRAYAVICTGNTLPGIYERGKRAWDRVLCHRGHHKAGYRKLYCQEYRRGAFPSDSSWRILLCADHTSDREVEPDGAHRGAPGAIRHWLRSGGSDDRRWG